MATKRPAVVGVFKDKQHAQQAIQELRAAGFRANQIGVMARDQKLVKDLKANPETKAEKGAVAGVATGAALGGLWGLGIAAGLLTPLGPIIAGGSLAAILASAATGAAVAGLAGFLIGLGIPEEDTYFYEKELKAGRIIITVKGGTRDAESQQIIVRNEGYNASTLPTAKTNARGKRGAANG